jgi:NAD(P)-dependent dehydrogenase (short-subunit alcohol dehydrogenase family)
MLRRGAKVALFGRDRAALDRAAAECPGSALPFAFDLCDRDALVDAVAAAHDAFGRLDGLVNNAGLSLASALAEARPEDVLAQVNLNFVAAVFASQAVIPFLRRQGGGRILMVGSASARHMDEFAHIGIYSATKAALERFAIELRQELKADGIGVTIFSPGGTETSFGSGWDPASAAAAFAEWLRRASEFDGSMPVAPVGEAIANCFELPHGMAFDFVELRANQPMSRRDYAENLYAQRADNP